MIENYPFTTIKQPSKLFITMKWLLVAISCYILFIAVPNMLNEQQQTEEVRLRVVANSNASIDQRQKQQIAQEAIQLLPVNKKVDSDYIAKVLNAKYPQMKIRVVYGSQLFPAKYTQGIFTPQNYYPSFVVYIGQARGDNWWCTLFSNVCERNVNSKERQEKKRVKFWILQQWNKKK